MATKELIQKENSKVHEEVLDANGKYVKSFGDKGKLPLPPGRKFAILTCMDARLDPAKYAGLSEGDAHVIRNAGGRASDDAIRSLVISHKLLGTQEWFVIHHTDCGMELFTDDIIRGLLSKSLKTATVDEKGCSFRHFNQFTGFYIINITVHRYVLWHQRMIFYPLHILHHAASQIFYGKK